jgi:hypothetical protein
MMDNPELKLEARFPSMDEFRLVVRTYAIKVEFELFVFKTDRERCDAYCKANKNCTWHVHACFFYFNQLKCFIVLLMLVGRGNQGRTPLRVGFQLKFQHRIGTPTQMKICSQQGKKKCIHAHINWHCHC